MGIERAGFIFVLAALALGGCSLPTEVRTAAPSPTPTVVSPLISKTTWTNGDWPFSVPDGVLNCYAEDSMQTFTSGGVEYGLNATARHFGNFRDIDEIVPAGPSGYVDINGTKQPVKTYAISLDKIYARANQLCA